MVFVDADCKVVPNRITWKSDDLYVASFYIWAQAHKPLHHPIDVNCFIYPGTVLIDHDTVPRTKIIFEFCIKDIFALLLLVF